MEFLVVLGAVTVQWLAVPRLRTPILAADDPVPDFTPLGRWPHLLAVACLAALVAVGPLRADDPWPWIGYAVLGAPLAMVDWRTTYLPNQLMWPLWAAMAAGLGVVALRSPATALAGLVGAVAAHAAFWLVWRVSSSFGFGDVRLAAAAGAVAGLTGATAWAVAMVAATFLGAIAAVVTATRGGRTFPYGPWLWLGPVVGHWLTGW